LWLAILTNAAAIYRQILPDLAQVYHQLEKTRFAQDQVTEVIRYYQPNNCNLI
jgi:ABC-type uncharacterized transport system YnjBCD substrate-binding protein